MRNAIPEPREIMLAQQSYMAQCAPLIELLANIIANRNQPPKWIFDVNFNRQVVYDESREEIEIKRILTTIRHSYGEILGPIE